MGKFRIKIDKDAQKDFDKIYHSGNKSMIKKVEAIVHELAMHPYTGTGHPEPLKHQLSGFWSRRITKKDRLIYQVFEEPMSWCSLFRR